MVVCKLNGGMVKYPIHDMPGPVIQKMQDFKQVINNWTSQKEYLLDDHELQGRFLKAYLLLKEHFDMADRMIEDRWTVRGVEVKKDHLSITAVYNCEMYGFSELTTQGYYIKDLHDELSLFLFDKWNELEEITLEHLNNEN